MSDHGYQFSANGGFNVHIEISCWIDDEGFWPLGENHPGRVPTAVDAAEVMRRYVAKHGWPSLIGDWNLAQDIVATVDQEAAS